MPWARLGECACNLMGGGAASLLLDWLYLSMLGYLLDTMIENQPDYQPLSTCLSKNVIPILKLIELVQSNSRVGFKL